MLILSRRIGETLHLGDNITVTVQQIHGNYVKLGVQAPDDVIILRDELYQKNDLEFEEAV